MSENYPVCENESECWYQQDNNDNNNNNHHAYSVKYKENLGCKYELYTNSRYGGDFYFCDMCHMDVMDDIPTTPCSICGVRMVDKWIEWENSGSYCSDCINEDCITTLKEEVYIETYYKDKNLPIPSINECYRDDHLYAYMDKNGGINVTEIVESLLNKTCKDVKFIEKMQNFIDALHEEKGNKPMY